jgi:type I restriction enzyme S subunit
MTPEALARIYIDQLLQAAGWQVHDLKQANIHATTGVAIREFPLNTGHGVGFGSSEFHVLRPSDKVDAKYLNYFVSSQAFRKEAPGHMTGAVGLRHVPAAFLADAQLPLVDLEEQRRIVAEIEKQFSRLGVAVANLQRVKDKLKRYKASILKAAVEGRSYETGEQLLQQILEERRTKWVGRGKWKIPKSPSADTSLPDGLLWSYIDQLADVGTGATPKRDKALYWSEGDVPWVTSGVVNGDYVDEASKFVTKLALAETNLTIYPVATLMVAMYGEGKTRGKCAELRIPARTNQALAALQVASAVRGYVRQFLELNYEEKRKVASCGDQPNVNLSLVRTVCVPLPPLEEQIRIVAEVDRHLSTVREVEAEIDTNLKRGRALRQASLRCAFLGA